MLHPREKGRQATACECVRACVCVCVRVYAVSTGETGTTTHRQLWKHSQPWIPQLIIIDILAAEGPG